MPKPIDLVPTAPLPLLPQQRVNFMYALMKAVGRDQDSMSMMQMIDAKSTELSVDLEQKLYAYWNGVLEKDDVAIQKVVVTDPNASSEINKLQSQYNVDSSTGQSNESQEDGVVQSTQGQTSTDASNLQMKAQMIQGVNSIQSALTNMLGNVIA